jgi:hypothetical protein
MAARKAHLSSIEAVRALKAALVQFGAEVQAALDALELESRRPVEWIEHDQSQYWPREVLKRSDRLSEARLALQKCELTIDGSESRYCYDERKALERAKQRMRTAEEKVQAVRRWRATIRKEVEEFQVQVEKLRHYLTSDFLQAGVALERMAAALDRYVEQQTPLAPTASPAGPSNPNTEPSA